MLLADKRIEVDARPVLPTAAVLEVALLGHCPGRRRWQRLAGDALLLNQIRQLGFHQAVARLQELAVGSQTTEADQEGQQLLIKLPLPIRSLGQFQDIFPDAFDSPSLDGCRLTGKRAWLPPAVQDFFAGIQAEDRDSLRLWVIPVEEKDGASAFLPDPACDLSDPESLGAFERAMLIPRLGIIALPDLERLQIPADLHPQPPVLQDVQLPGFLPLSAMPVDTEPDGASASASPVPELLTAQDLLPPILRTLGRLRPDVQCLFTLPFEAGTQGEMPVPSQDYLDYLQGVAELEYAVDESQSANGTPLRHLVPIFPYLRGINRRLTSAVGLLAGTQALISQRYGPWRSIGDRPLPGNNRPWPPLSQQTATRLREKPGITILLHRAGRTVVDDERMCVPCLPPLALCSLRAEQRRDECWRSAEIMRFLGWLRRELQHLGEKLVFDVDPRDPRPEMALRAFFGRLYEQGALRGALPEQAYRLQRHTDGESTVIFDIEIAPAFPIDRLRLTFVHDRNSGSSTSVEAARG